MSPDAFGQSIVALGIEVPPAVTHFHSGPGVWQGTATVTRGDNLLVGLLLWIGGFPPSGEGIPTSITISPSSDGHVWTRCFGSHTTRSTVFHDAEQGTILERFGPFTVVMRLSAEAGHTLRVHAVGARLFGLPLPDLLIPRTDATERQTQDGQFAFDISGRLPLLGLLIRYSGTLAPAP